MGLLLIFLDPPESIITPEVTTDGATLITQTTARLNATIVRPGGTSCTEIGIEFNTIPYTATTPKSKFYEIGSYGSESFYFDVDDLTPGQIYYYRAYATNPGYTEYGEWKSFIALPATYKVEINGVDRTNDIIYPSLQITDAINDEIDTCSFALTDRNGVGFPEEDDEIIITLNDETIGFGGYIVTVSLGQKMQNGAVIAQVNCVDYARDLDGSLVHKTYENKTDKEIFEDVVATYCAGKGITTTNVLEGVTIEQISFNYLQPSQCFKRLCQLTGRNWFIDYEKDIHYFPLETDVAPFNIDETSANYRDLVITKDSSQVKNRVYVRGGTKLSDFVTYTEVGDGEKRQFVLPDKPHNITVKVDRGGGFVEESVGIKNIDTTDYKWYLNYQEKYIEQDDAETVLSSTDVLRVTYKYDIPILVAVENTPSILEHGVKEFAIFDKNIRTTQSARDRASAELTDYANSIIEGSFTTYETGFRSGQYININHSDFGVNANYIVQKVVATSMGAGKYVYNVSIASAKTMGIVKFLIELLEANKNIVELDDNEVVDELLSIADQLISDSLTDSLTIDSAGPFSTWCVDSLETTPTRMVWGLFQWG